LYQKCYGKPHYRNRGNYNHKINCKEYGDLQRILAEDNYECIYQEGDLSIYKPLKEGNIGNLTFVYLIDTNGGIKDSTAYYFE
jgi:hypothetical protein